MTDMITGVVIDVVERGALLVAEIAPTPASRTRVAALAGDSLLRASIMGALAHGDRVAIGYDRSTVADAVDALGVARRLSVLDYEAVAGHAA